MHKHDHEHILKHCPVCDTVYCEGCGREWTTPRLYHSGSIYPPYTITYGEGTSAKRPVEAVITHNHGR
jgi:hypothetical protein